MNDRAMRSTIAETYDVTMLTGAMESLSAERPGYVSQVALVALVALV